jgi:hypothetical protein
MVPSTFIQNQISKLLANDTASLAAATAMKVHLANAPFTPAHDMLPSSMSEATFPGYAAKAVTIGPQASYIDATTGLVIVELEAPIGGWSFLSTTAPTTPETIYGYYVMDNAGAQIMGTALLDVPVTISSANQGFDLGEIKFSFSNNSPF